MNKIKCTNSRGYRVVKWHWLRRNQKAEEHRNRLLVLLWVARIGKLQDFLLDCTNKVATRTLHQWETPERFQARIVHLERWEGLSEKTQIHMENTEDWMVVSSTSAKINEKLRHLKLTSEACTRSKSWWDGNTCNLQRKCKIIIDGNILRSCISHKTTFGSDIK